MPRNYIYIYEYSDWYIQKNISRKSMAGYTQNYTTQEFSFYCIVVRVLIIIFNSHGRLNCRVVLLSKFVLLL